MKTNRVAVFLGWFSIGIGLARILAPRSMARLIGVRGNRSLLRMIGMREIASGVGILSRPRPAPWLWSRVGGDMMDLALLGAAFTSRKSKKGRLAAATAAVAGVTALDVLCSKDYSRRDGEDLGTLHVRKSIIINRPSEELHRFWRDFENLPRFMSHLESVRATTDRRSHWVAIGPAGKTVEWDAEVIDDIPNELIAWRSLPGSDVDTAGVVRFERATGGRGTVVKVEMIYRPPAGRIGATVARVFGLAPEKQLPMDLLRFKQLLETGEIARTEGQPTGRPRSTSRRYDELVRA